MKKWLLVPLLFTPGLAMGGGVQTSLYVSSGTTQKVSMYSNDDGANRQAIVIGDFSSSDTVRVDSITGLRVSLSTSALTTSGALRVVSTSTILETSTAEIGNVKNSGTFAVQSTHAGGALPTTSTFTLVTSSYPINVAGSFTFTPPALTTVTFNNIAQPVTSSYTVVTTTYPINVSGSFSFTPPAVTTVTFNGQAQPVTSTSVVITSTYSINTAITNTPTVNAAQSGTWTTQIGNTQNTIPIQVISTNTIVAGSVASSTTNSGNPIKIGVVASTAVPTKVANGSVTDARGTASGNLLVTLNCPRELIVKSSITITASTTETVILSSGAAGIYNDLLFLVAVNTSAAAVRVDFRSGGGPTGGTIDFGLEVPAADNRGFVLPGPWPQTLAAANWTAQVAATTTDIRIYGLFCMSR